MKRRRIRLQKVVLWRWIMSYVVIMIIPLLFGVGIYVYALGTVKDEVKTIQRQAIEQVKFNLDSMLENLYKVSYALSSSAYSSGIYIQRENRNPYDSLSMAQVQKTMGSYGIANNHIRGIYMYFPDNDYLMSSTLIYKYQNIVGSTKRFLGMTEDEFSHMVRQGGSGHLTVLPSKNEISQLYYVYNGLEFQKKIVVFMPLNMKMLSELAKIKNTGICLLVEGQPLWLGDFKKESIPDELFLDADETVIETVKDGASYWMGVPLEGESFENADTFLATYISGDAYFEKIDGMRQLLFIYLAVSVVLGGACAGIFSQHHYMPVRKLMQGIEADYIAGESEYDIIADYFTSMKEKYKASRQELLEGRQAIHNSRLSRLLHTSTDKISAGMWEKIEGGSLFLNGEYVLAGVLIAHEESSGLAKDTEDDKLNQFIVNNIISEVLASKFKIISGEVDAFLVYLIHFEDTDSMDKLIKSLEYALYYIDKFYHISITINLSRSSCDWERIGNAFDEVKTLQEYRDWSASDEVCIRTASDFYFPGESEQASVDHYHKYIRMVQYMKEGHYDQVDLMLQQLLNRETEQTGQSIKTTRKDKIVGEIVDYIEMHYDDWQLSGKMFADRYQVSLSYLSQIFKKEKGIGLLDYINQIRYSKAKAMIDAGDTIQEAARKAGYSTTQPLRRLFRQFEGMTPSQSRKKKS